MAITWRNVEGPNFRDAILAGTTAQQQMNAGFDNFNKILEQETKTNLANWDNTKQNNTQEAMNELMRYRTPEEYQAAQASGALDALRQRYGAQMDQAAFRAAEDGRLAALQQRAVAGIDFKNKTLEEQLRPTIQAAKILGAKGDTAGLRVLMENNPTLRDFMGGTLTAEAIQGERAAADETRKQGTYSDGLETSKAQREHWTNQARTSLIQANASVASAAAAARSASALEGQRLIDSITKVEELGKAPKWVGAYKGGNLVSDSLEGIAKELKDSGATPGMISNILSAAAKYSKSGTVKVGGKELPIPLSVIKTAAMAANTTGPLTFEAFAGSRFDSQMETLLKNKAFLGELQNDYDNSIKATTEKKNNATELKNALYGRK